MTDVLKQVRMLAQQERLLAPQDRVVVAVSGGPDSVALLHVLRELAAELGLRLVAAHANHRLRGEESERDARWVRQLAERWGIPVVTGELEVASYAREAGIGTQEAARIKRYEFLEAVARQHGCNRVALGHHADDQAETVLMRILRGAGTDGLRGIPIRRMLNGQMELIRPLLRITKRELLEYCEQHGLPYLLDSSNLQRSYFRNRVRLETIPYLEQLHPGLSSRLVQLADILGAEGDYLEEETRRIFENYVTSGKDGCSFGRNQFLGLHIALQRRLIKLILSYLFPHLDAMDFDKVESIRKAIGDDLPSTLSLDLGDGVSFVREYDLIRFVFRTTQLPPFAHELEGERGRLELREVGAVLEWRVLNADEPGFIFPGNAVASPSAGDGTSEAFFDLDQIHLPLSVRNRRPGDRMSWAGLNGTRKVKDMFIDLKIPPSQRERIPLVVDARGNILWIPGLRRSLIGMCGAGTKRCLHMAFRPYIQ